MDVPGGTIQREWRNNSQTSLAVASISTENTLLPSIKPLSRAIEDTLTTTKLGAVRSFSCLQDCKKIVADNLPQHSADFENACDDSLDGENPPAAPYSCDIAYQTNGGVSHKEVQNDESAITTRYHRFISSSLIGSGHHYGQQNCITASTSAPMWLTESAVSELTITAIMEMTPPYQTSVAMPASLATTTFSHITSESLDLVPTLIFSASPTPSYFNSASATILSVTPLPSTHNGTGPVSPSGPTYQPSASMHPSLWSTLSLAAKISILLSALLLFILFFLASLFIWHRRRRQRPLSTTSTLSFSDIGIPATEFRVNTPPDLHNIRRPEEVVLSTEANELRTWTRENDGEVFGRRKMALGGELVRGMDGRWVLERGRNEI